MEDKDAEMINRMLDESQAAIRQLNDRLRVEREGGVIVITPGIAGLGPSTMKQLLDEIAAFTDFTEDNDPHGEHDCAVMTVAGIRIIWKIDYYDLTRRYLSPNAADPEVTVRVMTIMRADEY